MTVDLVTPLLSPAGGMMRTVAIGVGGLRAAGWTDMLSDLDRRSSL